MKRWMAIINPAAGHGRCGKLAEHYLDILRDRGLSIDSRCTGAPGDAVEMTREALAAGENCLIALGGDGTANEVVNGIARHAPEGTATLATLPLGTGNSFLADFGMQEIDAALDRIAAGRASPCDLLRCTITEGSQVREHWSLNNVVVGFGADVGDLMNRRLKRFGQFGYTLGVMLEVARLNPPAMRLSIDGQEEERCITMINIGNSQYTGGNMRISPTSIVDDGLADVVTVEKLTRRQLLRAFGMIFDGRHIEHPLVNVVRCRHVSISAERPLPLLFDGDVVGTTPLEVEVVPGALRVVR